MLFHKRSVRLSTAGLAVLMPVASIGLGAKQASAGTGNWWEVTHNIKGNLGNKGALTQADHFINHLNFLKPIVGGAQEVCSSQFERMKNALNAEYTAYFFVAKETTGNCKKSSSDKTDFGNAIFVRKDIAQSYNASGAYQAAGYFIPNYSKVYFNQYNGVEHKRMDCVLVAPDNVPKFSACTTHTTAEGGDPDPTWIQMMEVKMHLNVDDYPNLLMGDLNTVQYVVQNLGGWRWDTLHTNEKTHAAGKIDWVLGESNAGWNRPLNSQRLGKGASDHELLLAYLEKTP